MDIQKVIIGAVLIALGVFAGFYLSNSSSKESGSFTSAQKNEIETIVHDYLIKEPEVLVKASQELQKKSQEKQVENAMAAISTSTEELIKGESPVMGNAKGDIILVEFMDYQCGHCKRMEKVIDELISDNPNLKVVIKPLPIFGEESMVASKAALAAAAQGKFSKMHQALLREKAKLNEEKVFALAKENGIDIDKLKKDMDADAVEEEINNAYELALKISIQGTPYMIIMGDPEKGNDAVMILPGAAHKEHLQSLIDKVANGSK